MERIEADDRQASRPCADGRATTTGPRSVLATVVSEGEAEKISAEESFNSLECSPAPRALRLFHVRSNVLLSTATTGTGDLIAGGVIQRLGT